MGAGHREGTGLMCGMSKLTLMRGLACVPLRHEPHAHIIRKQVTLMHPCPFAHK